MIAPMPKPPTTEDAHSLLIGMAQDLSIAAERHSNVAAQTALKAGAKVLFQLAGALLLSIEKNDQSD